ncbi:MAG: DUF4129 domain-containing protein [Haloferacaceae archaeon]
MMQVDRRTVAILVVGLVGVSALVLSAATLTDPAGAESERGWIDFGAGEDAVGELFTGTVDLPIQPLYLDLLWDVLAVASLVFLLVSVVFLDRGELFRVVLGLTVIALLGAVFALLLGNIDMNGFEMTMNGTRPNETGMSLPTGESASPGSGGISALLLGVGALVVLVAVGLLFVRSGDEEAPVDADEDEDAAGGDGGRLASLGEAAGRAAAGIAAADVATENAVYEAWVDMTGALDVPDPETTTPGEFAEAAVDAGMDPVDVRELTRLFEEVRYGDAPVSPERAERARAALNRIESAYAGDEP